MEYSKSGLLKERKKNWGYRKGEREVSKINTETNEGSGEEEKEIENSHGCGRQVEETRTQEETDEKKI